MKLTDNEAKILRAIHLDANLTANEISRISGVRECTVITNVRRLAEKGLLRRSAFINLRVLGYTLYHFLFSTTLKSDNDFKRLTTALVSDDRVVYLGEHGGEYQLELTIASRSVEEAAGFFDNLCNAFGSVFQNKVMAVRLSLTLHGYKFIAMPKAVLRPLRWHETMERPKIDEVDHKILSGVSNFSYCSTTDLARQLGMPQSNVHHRLQRLQERGIIKGFFNVVEPSRFGMLSFLFLIYAFGSPGSVEEKLTSFCNEHKNIDVALKMFGSWDYQLVVQVNNNGEAVEVSKQLQSQFPNEIVSIKILPLVKLHKVSDYPFKQFRDPQ